MDPYGRHHHHHGERDDEEEDRRGPPPPQYGYGQEGYGRPAPPPYGQEGYGHAPPPPRNEYGHGHPPPPQQEYGGYGQGGYGQGGGYAAAPVQHVSHVSHHSSGPAPAPAHGHGGGSNAWDQLLRQPTYRIYCKANEGVCLAIRNGTVLLVTSNENDPSQHWYKDLKYSTKVKDEEGYPAFAIVNKATRQALKHSLGQSHPVLVTEYNPEKLDSSVLWTESRDVGSNYRCIRMVNNIYLNFDGFHGDKEHGGVHDGTTIVLWEWTEGDNQRWKIVPW